MARLILTRIVSEGCLRLRNTRLKFKNAQCRFTLWQEVPLDPRTEASQTATRVLLARLDIAKLWVGSINGDAVDCKSAAFGHDWFDPGTTHQIFRY